MPERYSLKMPWKWFRLVHQIEQARLRLSRIQHIYGSKPKFFRERKRKAKYLWFMVRKIVLDRVQRRKGSLVSGITLVWSLSSQNLIHTDIKFGCFAKHKIDPLLVQLVTVINAC